MSYNLVFPLFVELEVLVVVVDEAPEEELLLCDEGVLIA